MADEMDFIQDDDFDFSGIDNTLEIPDDDNDIFDDDLEPDPILPDDDTDTGDNGEDQDLSQNDDKDQDADKDKPTSTKKVKPASKKLEDTDKSKNTDKPDRTDEEDEAYKEQIAEISEVLISTGLLNLEEGEEAPTDDESLLASVEKTLDKRANQKFVEIASKFGAEHRDVALEAMDAIFNKGIHPKDFFPAWSDVVDYESLDLKDEEDMKFIFREHHKNLEWEDDDIEEELKKVIDYGDLEKVTPRYHKGLVKTAQKRLEDVKANAVQEQKARELAQQQYEQSVSLIVQEKLKSKVFDGIPITKETADQIKDYMTKPAFQLEGGGTWTKFEHDIWELKKPENREKQIKLAILLSGQLDLSKIQKTAVSTDKNRLFNKQRTQERVNSRSSVRREEQQELDTFI